MLVKTMVWQTAVMSATKVYRRAASWQSLSPPFLPPATRQEPKQSNPYLPKDLDSGKVLIVPPAVLCMACRVCRITTQTRAWAAQYYTGLLVKLMPKGVVFSFLLYSNPHLPENFDGGVVLVVATAVLCMGGHVCHIHGTILPAAQQLVHLLCVEQLQPFRWYHLHTRPAR